MIRRLRFKPSMKSRGKLPPAGKIIEIFRARAVRWLPFHLDCILPCVALIFSVFFFASLLIQKANDVLDLASKQFPHGNKIVVQRFYLASKDYLEYSPTLARLNPGVSFALDQQSNALVLTINNEELFPDLMMALHTLQAFRPGIAWEVNELCIKACPGNAVARVAVKGFKQELHQ
jgi:hypothetical protein